MGDCLLPSVSDLPIYEGMSRRTPAALVALFLLVHVPPAFADCTDPAAPGVNWRRCYHDGRALVGVDLTGAQLRDATFTRANLSDAILVEVDAYRAKFVSAKLTGAVLDRARLIEADFTRADLTDVSLVEADLRNAKLVNAILREADLTGARIAGTDLRRADLSGATWIDGKRVCAENSIGQCN